MSESSLTRKEPAVVPFDALRKQFPLLQDVAYFQTGSLAPLAGPVRDAAVRALEAEGTSALAGPGAYAVFHQEAEEYRARLASFLGVCAPDIGWAASTTTAIRHAIDCFDWQSGDTLITTNREHISTRSLQDGLRQRYDGAVEIVEAAHGDDRLLSDLERALLEQLSPRLVLLSQVSCQDGRRLPVKEAVRIAHSHEVPVLVDGAQSLGQFPVDIAELECDLFIGSAHKWLLGPAGLGFLHVAPYGLVTFDAPFAMASSDAGGACAAVGSKSVAAGIELGTASMAARAGLAAALDLIESIGLANVEQHISVLTDQLLSELATIPGITVLSSSDRARRTGITSFAVGDSDQADLTSIVSQLWEIDKVVAKVQVEHPSIRISVAAFNNAEDIARLAHALRSSLVGPAH